MRTTFITTSFLLCGLSGLSSAAYNLQDVYDYSNFWSKFNFMTGNDPTSGYVNYVDQPTAQSRGYINTNNNQVYMGVDHTNVASGRGRDSVRLESKSQYTHGLFILDLNHMPGGICGVWPAFWTYGPNWPNSGEIDVIEGVNSANYNAITLHTGGTCTMNPGSETGQSLTTNCVGSAGCTTHDNRAVSYGSAFNNQGGGVYAMEWTSSVIRTWFFPRGQVPSDINNGNPNPPGWGTPVAAFPNQNSCNINGNFMNHWITFDTTFCGGWAGDQNVWNADSTCSAKAPNCQTFVQNNPSAFNNAYWIINTLKVYQNPQLNTKTAMTDGEGRPVPIVNGTVPVGGLMPTATNKPAKLTQVPILGLSPNDNGSGVKPAGVGKRDAAAAVEVEDATEEEIEAVKDHLKSHVKHHVHGHGNSA